MAFIRRVRTGSGATAVQVVQKRHGRLEVLKHVGSAHSEVELAVLLEKAEEIVQGGQQAFDLGIEIPAPAGRLIPEPQAPALFTDKTPPREPVGPLGRARVVGSVSEVLWQTLQAAYRKLGFDTVGDTVFEQLVLARLVEPTSKLDSLRVLAELGVDAPHRNTLGNCLRRVNTRGYRAMVADRCFEHVVWHGDLTLCLYDVTTLYFEAENEDELRKVGYSKERRVDPQIVVGLLVDRNGFPLEIGCFEGNYAETRTIVPIVRQFQERHNLADMVIVADAGMLSATNLAALDEADLKFIVGSRVTKAPADLDHHFHDTAAGFEDGQVIDTITPRRGRTTTTGKTVAWDPDSPDGGRSWRAVWQYSAKRAARDVKTLGAQEERARNIISGIKPAKSARFVTTTSAGRRLDEASLGRAYRLVGLKGYVTNIPASLMPASEVIGSYHDLWRVEQSFRMSKTDLAARPIFHHTRDAIEAHLTIVFTALAVARYMQDATGLSLKRIITSLKPLRSALIQIGQATQKFPPEIPDSTQHIIFQITGKTGH